MSNSKTFDEILFVVFVARKWKCKISCHACHGYDYHCSHACHGHHGHQDRQDNQNNRDTQDRQDRSQRGQTGQTDLTFKLNFPGNVWMAAFAILAVFLKRMLNLSQELHISPYANLNLRYPVCIHLISEILFDNLLPLRWWLVKACSRILLSGDLEIFQGKKLS